VGNAAERGLQEPLACVCLVLVRQVHQHRHETAIRKDELALLVGAVSPDPHRL
jgi:hypothetical protein